MRECARARVFVQGGSGEGGGSGGRGGGKQSLNLIYFAYAYLLVCKMLTQICSRWSSE